MIFSDLELARRLEQQEAAGGVSFVQARRRLSPESAAECIHSHGVYALFDGPHSPLSQTFGLGLYEPVTPEALDALEAFFSARQAPIAHELCPLSGIEVQQLLCQRGYRPVELTSVMYKEITPEFEAPANPSLTTRLMQPGEEDSWSLCSASGWTDQPEFREFLLDFGRIMAASDGLHPFFALLDGQPAATAVLRCHQGVALLAGASTMPQFRNQGAQRALLEARLQLARSQGCDLAMMCAAPGSASQRNAERQGFRIAYTRTKWQRKLPSRHHETAHVL